MPTWTLTARWVLPIAGLPLEGGTVTITGERILAVEPHGCRTPDMDLDDAAVLPGFVNAHTHLDLTGLRGKVPPAADFIAWLRAVMRHRRSLSPGQIKADIAAGLAESLAYGTTLLGDISSEGLSWPELAAGPLRAAVFYELLGLPRTRAHRAWAAACAWLRVHPATATCRPGLSPHAPYSVRASLFRAAANLCQRQHIPLAIHIAETRAELELFKQQRGPFASFLAELGVCDPEGLVRDAEEVLRLSAQAPSILLAHGNYLDPSTPIPRGGTVVYCPRTHAAFGHEIHPFRELLAAGVRVALGTDSLASNPDLDVLAEARFLHKHCPDVPAASLLRMATLSGAEALGWQSETGSLEPGKSADLIALPLSAERSLDPQELVLSSSARAQAVLFRGRWVHGVHKAKGKRKKEKG